MSDELAPRRLSELALRLNQMAAKSVADLPPHLLEKLSTPASAAKPIPSTK